MKNLTIAALVILLGLVSFKSIDFEDLKIGDTSPTTNAIVEQYSPLVVTAFDDAEKEFIKKIDIDEDIQRAHPDPKKCPCKGTGLMPTDGAVTLYCKYHAKRANQEEISKILQEIDQLRSQLETRASNSASNETDLKNQVAELVEQDKKNQERLKFLYKELKKANCQCTPEECVNGTCPCGENCQCHTNAAKKVETTVSINEDDIVSYKRKEMPKNNNKVINYQVVMFSANWCSPCVAFKKNVLPEFTDLIKELEVSSEISADIRVLDVDDPQYQNYYISLRNNDRTLPMFVEFKNNRVVSRSTGTKDKDVQYLLDTYDFEEKE